MSLQQPTPTGDPFAASDEPDEPVTTPPDEPAALVVDEPEAGGPGLLARVGAELFGTFVLVFAGVGTYLYSQLSNGAGALGVALAFGIAAAVGLVTIGRVSGGHLNPAVSLGAAVSGRLSWADLLPYWLAQLVGGALAAAVLFLTVPDGLATLFGSAEEDKRELLGATANGFGPHSPLADLIARNNVPSSSQFSLATALLVEVVATGILVGVYLAVTRRRHEPRGAFAVGATFAALVLVTLPITNAGLNPARSTAVAILAPSWALSQLWLFWVAPLLGAALAALLYRAFAGGSAAAAGAAEVASDELDDEDDFADSDDVDGDGDEGETMPVLPA